VFPVFVRVITDVSAFIALYHYLDVGHCIIRPKFGSVGRDFVEPVTDTVFKYWLSDLGIEWFHNGHETQWYSCDR
jgi:hypothetical protein